MTDIEVLKKCYDIMYENGLRKRKKGDISSDKKLAAGLLSSCSKLLIRLDPNMEHTMADIQKYLLKAKGSYAQYICIKARNPGCISQSLDKNFARL